MIIFNSSLPGMPGAIRAVLEGLKQTTNTEDKMSVRNSYPIKDGKQNNQTWVLRFTHRGSYRDSLIDSLKHASGFRARGAVSLGSKTQAYEVIDDGKTRRILDKAGKNYDLYQVD